MSKFCYRECSCSCNSSSSASFLALICWFVLRRVFLVAPVCCSLSQSYVTTVPLPRSSIWYGLHCLLKVLSYCSLLFALFAIFFECILSDHGALLEGEVVHCGCFALSAVVAALFCSQCARWENNLYIYHVLRSANCCLHSLVLSFKIPVCPRRVIPFDIIMALDIFWPPALANSLPLF